jgi:flagellar biosynthesis/type III secretory pathway protein FliH
MSILIEWLLTYYNYFFGHGPKEETKMDILALLNALQAGFAGAQAAILELEAKLADAQAAVNEAVAMGKAEGKAEGDAEGYARGKDEGYALGFADGKASNPEDTTPFNQADVDAKVAEVVAPLAAKIAELEAKVAELEARPVGATPEEIAQFKLEAKAEAKLAFQAIVDAYLADEQAGDDALKAKLSEI